ncbi:hypothetical protein [Aquimarina agarilytica]|uniref:hypothetical protein n=1 Tax=Aquimarina agarilytica TaxID=1087449 RepID=UPI0002DB07D9|nr:hypothetical protein [Aquimarina agarilytica]
MKATKTKFLSVLFLMVSVFSFAKDKKKDKFIPEPETALASILPADVLEFFQNFIDVIF